MHVNFSLKFWQQLKSTLKILFLIWLHKYNCYSRFLIFRGLLKNIPLLPPVLLCIKSFGALQLACIPLHDLKTCRFIVNSEASASCLENINSEPGDLWNSMVRHLVGTYSRRLNTNLMIFFFSPV